MENRKFFPENEILPPAGDVFPGEKHKNEVADTDAISTMLLQLFKDQKYINPGIFRDFLVVGLRNGLDKSFYEQLYKLATPVVGRGETPRSRLDWKIKGILKKMNAMNPWGIRTTTEAAAHIAECTVSYVRTAGKHIRKLMGNKYTNEDIIL